MSVKHLTKHVLGFGAVVAALCAAAPAMAKPGAAGWQTAQTITVGTGTTDLFLHTGCPAGFSVQNGGIIPLGAQTVTNGFLFTGNGPRLDETPPGYSEWAWKIEWNNGGAPAGSQLTFNVLCKKGNP